MSDQQVMNRWIVVVGAVLIQLCLGAIYAWSVFTPPLVADTPHQLAAIYSHAQLHIDEAAYDEMKSELSPHQAELKEITGKMRGAEPDDLTVLQERAKKVSIEMDAIVSRHVPAENLERLRYGFSATKASWIFSVGLATFAIVMVWAGRQQAKVGPRPLAVAGGIVLGIGYILGGFFGNTFPAQLICIGVIGGAGIGLAYVVPIAVGVKWFPDKKGMITGLAVAGFGFGATIWVKLGGSWFGGLLNTLDGFLGLPGVQAVFVVYGITFLVVVLLGSIVMVNPPAGWQPKGWTPPAAGVAGATGVVELESGQMLRTPQFYGLFLIFTGSAMAGLMVIGCIKLFGIDALQASGAIANADEASAIAGTAMALYAILNGLGRIVWGTVSDTIGRKASIFLMCAFQGAIMLAFYKLGASEWGLIIGACIIGFNFGGNFALFPAATADFFGNKNVGKNYGWVFLAYGVAGIVGPQIAGYFKDRAVTADAWFTPFAIAGAACLAAAVLALLLQPPKATNGNG